MRLAICVAALVVTASCGAEGNKRGFIVTPGMDDSVPYDTYGSNPLAPNGLTLMTPPEGTIPVGHHPFLYGAGDKEMARAGRELTNPVKPTKEEMARAAHVYKTFCAVCHGDGGEGDGPIIGRFPNPPSLVAPRARKLADGALFHIITKGQGIMAPYAVQVRAEDRWRLVHHIRKLQGVDLAAALEAAPELGATATTTTATTADVTETSR